MKTIISFLLTTFLHAESPFTGAILANDSTHGGNGKLELLTNGKMMLIRQPGEGFKRASSLIDLSENSFTQIQHHNHSYTVVGQLEDWPKISERPGRPTPKVPKPPKVTVTEDQKEILGRRATRFAVEGLGERLEIWGVKGLPAFYQWFAFCPEPFPAYRLQDQIGNLCRQQKIFPLLIILKEGDREKTIFEVTVITPAKSGDQANPALDAKIYKLPTSHRLIRHPMQEIKRHEAERKKLNNQKTQ